MGAIYNLTNIKIKIIIIIINIYFPFSKLAPHRLHLTSFLFLSHGGHPFIHNYSEENNTYKLLQLSAFHSCPRLIILCTKKLQRQIPPQKKFLPPRFYNEKIAQLCEQQGARSSNQASIFKSPLPGFGPPRIFQALLSSEAKVKSATALSIVAEKTKSVS